MTALLCAPGTWLSLLGGREISLKGHILLVLLPNAFLQGRELGREEVMVQIHPLNGEHGT